MDSRIAFTPTKIFFENVPVYIDETDTCYFLYSEVTGDMLYYIEYAYLMYKVNSELDNQLIKDQIITMALLSRGKKNVPTICLLNKVDTTFNANVRESITSLVHLRSWIQFITCKINDIHIPFNPYESLQIAKIFQSLNIEELEKKEKRCFDDSLNMFNFEYNVNKITWFGSTIKDKYKVNIHALTNEMDVYRLFHPREAFIFANSVMRYVFVWEAAQYSIDKVIASNIIFLHFIQDCGASVNPYTPILQ